MNIGLAEIPGTGVLEQEYGLVGEEEFGRR